MTSGLNVVLVGTFFVYFIILFAWDLAPICILEALHKSIATIHIITTYFSRQWSFHNVEVNEQFSAKYRLHILLCLMMPYITSRNRYALP